MRPIVGLRTGDGAARVARSAVDIETFAPNLVLLVAVPLTAIWMYGVLHPLFNNGHLGVAILVRMVPGLALFYVALHRCRRTA